MIGMEFFDRIELCSLIIRVAREGIDESIDLADLWYKSRPKVSLIRRRTDEERTIFEEISPDTILAHCSVTDIAISDIHSIL
jgi:hypothetical protein